jgi:hypothetical protein
MCIPFGVAVPFARRHAVCRKGSCLPEGLQDTTPVWAAVKECRFLIVIVVPQRAADRSFYLVVGSSGKGVQMERMGARLECQQVLIRLCGCRRRWACRMCRVSRERASRNARARQTMGLEISEQGVWTETPLVSATNLVYHSCHTQRETHKKSGA